MGMFTCYPKLESERLTLRQMTVEDASALLQIFSDAEVTKDMGIKPFVSIEEALGTIQFMNELFQQDVAIRWGIVRKSDNQLIGTCGFNGWEVNRGSRGEIGYDLAKSYWRQGYMTEALNKLITFGFEEMGLNRIEAYTNLDAAPSIQLLYKIGFQKEGILRGYAYFHGEYWDQNCFSLLKHEWKINQGE